MVPRMVQKMPFNWTSLVGKLPLKNIITIWSHWRSIKCTLATRLVAICRVAFFACEMHPNNFSGNEISSRERE